MDIWRWVQGREEALRADGHVELANYIEELPSYVVDDRFDLVDQVYHAALPLCRALDDKWLEVYFRHWRLQGHVLKNYDAKGLLSEAILLLDFAHGEETKDCPQRICAVQDLASCYGIKDGPGFAEERISVCKETLAQIDGSWPCYECVSSELLDALIDKKDYEQAEAELCLIQTEFSKFQKRPDDDLVLTKTRMFLGKGEIEDAWRLIEKAVNPEGGEGFIRHVTLLKALTLCHMKRWEEAKEVCLPFNEIVLASTYYSEWTKIQILLVKQGIVENNKALRYQFHSLADKLIGKDAIRLAFEVCERLIELCIDAGESRRADYVIDIMKPLIGQLHRDLGASDTLVELERRASEINAPEETEPFDSATALLDYQFKTESQEFLAIAKGLETWPDNGPLYARQSDLFQSHFQNQAAYVFLEDAYKAHRGSAALESRYGDAFLAKHGFSAYQDKFPMGQLDGLSNGAIWNRGFKHIEQFTKSEPQKALEILKIIETYWAEDIWLMGRIARQHITLQDYDAAITLRRRQIEFDPEDDNHKWDLLIAATLSQNTPLIREAAGLLKIELNNEGHYAVESQSNIRLQWKIKNGDIATYHAVRKGPALARITSICRIDAEHQAYGCEVVFDPAPLNKLNHEDDEGYACDVDGNYSLLYPPPLLTLHDPRYKTYTIDGIHPGDDALNQLSAQIKAAGFIYYVWSPDSYQLTWEDKGKTRTDPAVYVYCLIQDGKEDSLNDMLIKFNQSVEHPLVWTELTNARKDEVLGLEQSEIIRKYGIEA